MLLSALNAEVAEFVDAQAWRTLRRRQAATSTGHGGCRRVAQLTDLLGGNSTRLDKSSMTAPVTYSASPTRSEVG
jgi:hypothetical protein